MASVLFSYWSAPQSSYASASVMEDFYFRCDSDAFYTKIVYRDLVLTPHNWLKIDR